LRNKKCFRLIYCQLIKIYFILRLKRKIATYEDLLLSAPQSILRFGVERTAWQVIDADSEYDEIFVKDLNKDSRPDMIITVDGPDIVVSVENTGIKERQLFRQAKA
jgi:hypothetical protein